ncbi:hypothetical protein ZYGR_0AD06700 [Zygosaccharomyces rouxii]|uniref:EH domain-containing protein n=1 Tax=Zygosaccharomyces rouxii TaxID=4956 RepID=A0A1Q3A748_ZYGRO|nr:hypothetical protein ZYGR_0AD06700 [Zygosaccharomyces rouxii]
MVQQKNRPYQGSSTPMSDKPMSDSLRAAQVIFQKHSDQPGQSNSTTPTSAAANGNLSSASNIRRGSSQSIPAKVAATVVKNRTVTPPPKNSSSTSFNHHDSPPPLNEQAHAAALLALSALNPGNDDENNHHGNHTGPSESEKPMPAAAKQKQSHLIPNQNLAHLYRVPSSRNSSTVNVATSNPNGSISLDDLPRLEVSRDAHSPIHKSTATTPSRPNLSSALNVNGTSKANTNANKQQHTEQESLLSPYGRSPTESQKQPYRQPAEQVKQQLKEIHKQPQQNLQQHLQQHLQSPPRPPSAHRVMSTPIQLPQRSLQVQTPQLQHPPPPEEQTPLQPNPPLTPHPYSSPIMSHDFEHQSLTLTPASQNSNQQLQQQQQQQQQPSPGRPISRTLTGRVPPPRIYLSSSGDEGTTDCAADNETDATSERPIRRKQVLRRDLDESSSSFISSDSPVSYGLENSSWEDPRHATVDTFGDGLENDEIDENNINEDDYDDYDDYEDDEDVDDEGIGEGYSLPPKVTRVPCDHYDFPETASLPNMDNISTSASTYSAGQTSGGPITTKPKRVQLKPAVHHKSVAKTSQPQSQLPPQSQQTPPPLQSPTQLQQQQPNIKYQGTLPDLIPNHTRRTKMEKLKSRIFGSHNGRSKNTSPFDFSTDRTSVTSDPEGHAVVKTNQNMRFKTTMRKDVYDGAYKDGKYHDQGDDVNKSPRHRYDSDSDEDSDSSTEHREEKPNRNRGIGIRKKLKHTAAVVPYSDHLLHMESRHTPRTFNEDKPWKSHNDVGFVTSQERKRYEGMWVSNRCMYLDLLDWWEAVLDGDNHVNVDLPDDGLMLNLVVKDIWSRSNLSVELLLQIYEMVDSRKDGTLDRKSFVVGMWLVDQCLYGRKLPKEIDQKVWSSVDKYAVSTINSTNLRNLDRTKKKQMRKEIKNIKRDIKNVHL